MAAGNERPRVGLWLRVGDLAKVPDALRLLQSRNDERASKGRRPPWIGLVLSLGWGQIEVDRGPLRTDALDEALRTLRERGFFAMVHVSDKSWQFQESDDRYVPAVPADVDRGPIPRADFARCADGICQDAFRYASMHDMRERGRRASAVRKYVAKRWVLKERWFAMWERLGAAIGDRPSLYAVLTPESALALPDRGLMGAVGYPGSDWFVGFLLDQASTIRRAFPSPVQVVSNVNVVPPDNAQALPKVAKGLAAAGLSIWAQDLNPDSAAYRVLYPQMERFTTERRWAMVTNGSPLEPAAMIDLARRLGVGHLAFLHEGFDAQVRAVDALDRRAAPFLPE